MSSEFNTIPRRDYHQCAMLDTGFNLFILLKSLLNSPTTDGIYRSKVLPTQLKKSDPVPRFRNFLLFLFIVCVSLSFIMWLILFDIRYNEAFYFFQSHTASVEIVREEHLERFYFPIPPICLHLTTKMKSRVLFATHISKKIHTHKKIVRFRLTLCMQTMLYVNRESPTQKIKDFYTIGKDVSFVGTMTMRKTLDNIPCDV